MREKQIGDEFHLQRNKSCCFSSFSATRFVEATTSDVTHPFDNVVVRIVQLGLKDFQVSDFEPGWCKWDLRQKFNQTDNQNPVTDSANTANTSKFIEIGGRVHFFFVSVCKSSISAESCDSFIPPIRLILSKSTRKFNTNSQRLI